MLEVPKMIKIKILQNDSIEIEDILLENEEISNQLFTK